MTKVKTSEYDLELLEFEIHDALNRRLSQPALALREHQKAPYHPSDYLTSWFAPPALESLLSYQSFIHNYKHRDVLRVILSRQLDLRVARLTSTLISPKSLKLIPITATNIVGRVSLQRTQTSS